MPKFIGKLLYMFPCFGHVHCPSSGVSQHCIHSNRYLSCQFCWCLLARSGHQCGQDLTTLANTNRTSMTNNYCCVYSVDILLMVDSGPVHNMYSTLSIKFELQCISLVFIIRLHHDAQSSECQISFCKLCHGLVLNSSNRYRIICNFHFLPQGLQVQHISLKIKMVNSAVC